MRVAGDHRRHRLVDLPGNSGALGCKLVGALLDSLTKGGGFSCAAGILLLAKGSYGVGRVG